MRATLRRVVAFRGQLAVLGALALVAAALATGVPRLAEHMIDVGLRERLTGLPYQIRDLTFQRAYDPNREIEPPPADPRPNAYRDLPPALRPLAGEGWYGAQAGPKETLVTDLPPTSQRMMLGLRYQTGVVEAATLTAGHWPRSQTDDGATDIVLSDETVAALGLKLGTRFQVRATVDIAAPVLVEVVGTFAPKDRHAAVWAAEPKLITPFVPVGEDDRFAEAVALVSESAIADALGSAMTVTFSWRYRIDESRLYAADSEELIPAVEAARRNPHPRTALVTGLDTTLARFGRELTAVRALLAVVQVGMLATLVGLVLLAARAAVERRRDELALLRARGATTVTLGLRSFVESMVVVPFAVALGWWSTSYLPGRPAGTGWLAVLLGLVTAAAVPVVAALSQRRITATRGRRDLARLRPSARRLTAEASVLVAAALGVVLLRRRGLSQDSVDVFLAAVPVLLAAAAAIIALRLFPWPLHRLGRLAGRSRGSVLFLGLSGAGRAAPASVGPVAVMVVAITTGVFSAVVTTTIDDARDRATDAAVGADISVSGQRFTRETTDRLAAVPGVTAVAPLALEVPRPLLSSTARDARTVARALAIVIDLPAYQKVMAASGIDLELPAALLTARPGPGPVPALVSPAVAAAVGGGAVATVQGREYEFRVADVAETFPTLDPEAPPFVVLPAQAMPAPPDQPILPTGFLVAGKHADTGQLVAVGDRGQKDWVASVSRDTAELTRPDTRVVTWGQRRAELERTGTNSVLRFTFAAGATAGTALALLAVAFAVLAGAGARGRVLSRLRTMGLSPRQGRLLLVVELAPLVLAAVAAGAAVGAGLPALLAPALGLRAFTEGYAVGVHLDPLVVGGVGGLVVAGLITALAVESAINRRLRLGEVLRLGEEN